MGLALSKIGNDFVRLPSGISLREAKVGHFEIGPLHDFLEKGVSEPSSVGQLENDTDGKPSKSQEDSPRPPERLQIQVRRVEGQPTTYD